MSSWYPVFPNLQELTLPQKDVRFHDRREWSDASWNQRFGVDFSRSALNNFVIEMLAPGIPPGDPETVVINVRRGDYYSDPVLRARYGFDQRGYIAAALDAIGSTEVVRVVSDDPRWCRSNLGELLDSRASSVTYDDADPVSNFLTIAGARTLIGTNSTFSYWGGHVSTALGTSSQIIMPRFHWRSSEGTAAYQLDPGWMAIDGFH